jgi:peptidoglycan/xylan/chitin deacetylase (PgdA/CDA1 family)
VSEPVSACLTFDFDAMSNWIGMARTKNPSELSRGEFAIVGVDRILKLLARHQIRSTFFIPGHTVYAFPDLVQRIAAEGHEIGHHGWVHENPADFDRDGERRNLEIGFEALDRVLGLRPCGYRSPVWNFSPNTVELLVEAEFVYETSCQAPDYYPYYLRRNDEWPIDAPYVFGPTTELIEMPVNWGVDDFPHFELVRGVYSNLSAPSKVLEIWQAEFNYMVENCPDGALNLTMHPQAIGRGHRMAMVERLIEHLSAGRARFEPLIDYVRRWKQANPVEQWMAENPLRTGINAIQSLER